MKTFIKNDFYIQVYFLVGGLLSIFVGIAVGWGIMPFYFVVGIPQLISFLLKIFQKKKKTISYIIYGLFIMPVWISFLIMFMFKNNHEVTNFFGTILIASLLYSPFLAILYVYDNYKLYQSLNQHK
ncbi:hypothetical protein A0O34_16385 [Chryseobacterium glaciei]|uniref:Uncharacterized protein n=1 Tax=Chryseobacterium glaciei TaxID=1685010 RepID=A0A172XYQ1_9FLAO|nr:hypothetical protein [Chryseobacterium glaciei]ANF51992.1 hypothetical protein A0O34_16385 [Chryseobacterium glaciei]